MWNYEEVFHDVEQPTFFHEASRCYTKHQLTRTSEASLFISPQTWSQCIITKRPHLCPSSLTRSLYQKLCCSMKPRHTVLAHCFLHLCSQKLVPLLCCYMNKKTIYCKQLFKQVNWSSSCGPWRPTVSICLWWVIFTKIVHYRTINIYTGIVVDKCHQSF